MKKEHTFYYPKDLEDFALSVPKFRSSKVSTQDNVDALVIRVLVFNEESHLLLLYRTIKGNMRKRWEAPGGEVEEDTPYSTKKPSWDATEVQAFQGAPDSSILESAVRETYEETGRLIVAFERQCHEPTNLGGSRQWAFIAKLDKLTPILLSDEHTNYKWFSAREIEGDPDIQGCMLDIYRQALKTSEEEPL